MEAFSGRPWITVIKKTQTDLQGQPHMRAGQRQGRQAEAEQNTSDIYRFSFFFFPRSLVFYFGVKPRLTVLKRCLTFSSQTSLCDIDLAYLKPWHPFLAHNLNGPWLIASLDILYTVCAQQHLLQYAHEHIHNSHTCTNKDNVESVSQRCEKGGKSRIQLCLLVILLFIL